MGIFDRLFGKHPPVEDDLELAAPAASDAPRAFYDLDDATKLARATAVLERLGALLVGARIKTLAEDDEVEVRARLDDVPVRVNVDYDRGWLRPEVKLENRVGTALLERDPTKVPRTAEPDDDWADGDALRTFVGAEVFLEGRAPVVAEGLAALAELDPGARERLMTGMKSLRLSRCYLLDDSIRAGVVPNLQDLPDPVAHLHKTLELLVATAQAAARGTRGSPESRATAAAPATPRRVRCGYCGTHFIPGLTASCPNCGAPATA